ncbi:MAG: TraR/DksA C4-type zinc finger protein [Acidimicrobiales bacterium]
MATTKQATSPNKAASASAVKKARPSATTKATVRAKGDAKPAAKHAPATKTDLPAKASAPAAKAAATSRKSAAGARTDQPRSGAELDAAVAAPKRVVEGYAKDEKFLASQRAALLRERSTYLEQAASLKAEAESLVEEMEPGDIQFDDESGEGGTVTVDRERDLALSAQAMAAVEEIDHTLAKIDNGTYGICENCGRMIVKARLEALPYARLCIDCKSGGLSRR